MSDPKYEWKNNTVSIGKIGDCGLFTYYQTHDAKLEAMLQTPLFIDPLIPMMDLLLLVEEDV